MLASAFGDRGPLEHDHGIVDDARHHRGRRTGRHVGQRQVNPWWRSLL
jgi:hypothetical protein